MAADSVGQIGLDLVVNQNQFKQQMAGIQGLAKKAGAALAAAFAVKKIIDFGAQCIELAPTWRKSRMWWMSRSHVCPNRWTTLPRTP